MDAGESQRLALRAREGCVCGGMWGRSKVRKVSVDPAEVSIEPTCLSQSSLRV